MKLFCPSWFHEESRLSWGRFRKASLTIVYSTLRLILLLGPHLLWGYGIINRSQKKSHALNDPQWRNPVVQWWPCIEGHSPWGPLSQRWKCTLGWKIEKQQACFSFFFGLHVWDPNKIQVHFPVLQNKESTSNLMLTQLPLLQWSLNMPKIKCF